jgi:hypothetical protein
MVLEKNGDQLDRSCATQKYYYIKTSYQRNYDLKTFLKNAYIA